MNWEIGVNSYFITSGRNKLIVVTLPQTLIAYWTQAGKVVQKTKNLKSLKIVLVFYLLWIL